MGDVNYEHSTSGPHDNVMEHYRPPLGQSEQMTFGLESNSAGRRCPAPCTITKTRKLAFAAMFFVCAIEAQPSITLVNSAFYESAVAGFSPGSLVSVFGTNLIATGSSTASLHTFPFPEVRRSS